MMTDQHASPQISNPRGVVRQDGVGLDQIAENRRCVVHAVEPAPAFTRFSTAACSHIVPETAGDRIVRVVLHPLLGPVLLALVLFLMFQAVFSWAALPMDAIESATAAVSTWVESLPPDIWLRSLIVKGVIAGAGGVLVFLPQIIILFFVILMLEDSGYLPRAFQSMPF